MAIWAVVKDPGGTAGVLPVVRVLRARGEEPLLFANGKAIEILKKSDERYIACELRAEEVLERFGTPEVLLTSMCSQGGIGRDLVELLAGKVPTVALQDSWGSRLWTAWAEPDYRPDFICVNDEVGQNIVMHAWPEFPRDCVKVTGYPALDRYFDYDSAKSKQEVREKLGLKDPLSVVFFGGQIKRTGEVLSELVSALNDLDERVYFIPRQHPRMMDDAPEQTALWLEALGRFRNGVLISDTAAFDAQSLIAASGVTVSMFSTVLVEAAVMRKQNISMLYPDSGWAEFVAETGGGMSESPIVDLGCSAKATNREELTDCLIRGLWHRLCLEDSQKRTFSADGKSAQRVANFICSLTG